MANERYSLYPSRFGDLLLRQLAGLEVLPNGTKSEPIPGGALDRGAVVTAFMEPVVRVRTIDFTGIFAGTPACSITTGYLADTTLGSPTAATLLQYQARNDGGTFKSGATDPINISSDKGFLYVEDISAEQDSTDGAMISLLYAAMSINGVNPPLVAAMASGGLTSTPTFNGIWYLGPVLIGTVGSGTAIDGLRRISIRPGIEFRAKRQDGGPYPVIGSIHSRKPEITFGFENAKQFYTRWPNIYGNLISGTSTQLAFYLQKGADGGARVAAATTSHIRVLAALGDVSPDDFTVNGEDDAGFSVTMRPTTTLALTTGVAIA